MLRSSLLGRSLLLAITLCGISATHQNAMGQNAIDQIFGVPTLEKVWTHKDTVSPGAEIVAFEKSSGRVFATNASLDRIDVLNLADGALLGSIDVSDLGSPTSVAAKPGLVGIAVNAYNAAGPQTGKVVFVDPVTLTRKSVVDVGYLPDMITFSPNGAFALTANEGEPKSDYSVDPEGSISVITVGNGTNPLVKTATFSSFNGQINTLRAAGVRIYGPNATVAQDIEPEYITFDASGSTAYVTLQENNAIAIVNVGQSKVTHIRPLGLKDHSLAGNGFDASDRDGPSNTAKINIANWPVFGMYQPDSISSYQVAGMTLLVSANEGDARDYSAIVEEVRVGATQYVLDPVKFPNAAALKTNAQLGRLTVTNRLGDDDNDGDFDRICVLGGRSFSIHWAAPGGQLIRLYDSGDKIEQLIKNEIDLGNLPQRAFNANNDSNANSTFDSRSDNKGPEPEALSVGQDLTQSIAFVGLERVGGVIVADVSNPYNVRILNYKSDRDFNGNIASGTGGDSGPEGITFIPRGGSSLNVPCILVANEISGTVTLYKVKRVGGTLSSFYN